MSAPGGRSLPAPKPTRPRLVGIRTAVSKGSLCKPKLERLRHIGLSRSAEMSHRTMVHPAHVADPVALADAS
jgi:hypothetical protein